MAKKKEIDLNNLPTSNEVNVDVTLNVEEFPVEEYYIECEDELDQKVIKFLEKQIRSSYEYRSYIGYLKNELDLTKCAIIPNLDIKEMSVSLEFHHFPLTLYDITEAVARKSFDESDGEPVSMFDIEERVMLEHYKNHVGLVPLTTTLHEMAHNRAINIPLDKVNGNYKEFLFEYNDFIPAETKDKLNIMTTIGSDVEKVKKENKEKLNKTIVNYNIKYQERN